MKVLKIIFFVCLGLGTEIYAMRPEGVPARPAAPTAAAAGVEEVKSATRAVTDHAGHHEEAPEDYTTARATIKEFFIKWVKAAIGNNGGLLYENLAVLTGNLSPSYAGVRLSPEQRLLAVRILLNGHEQNSILSEIFGADTKLEGEFKGALSKDARRRGLNSSQQGILLLTFLTKELFNFCLEKGSPEDKTLVVQAHELFKCYCRMELLSRMTGDCRERHLLVEQRSYGNCIRLLLSGSSGGKMAYYKEVQKLLVRHKECANFLSDEDTAKIESLDLNAAIDRVNDLEIYIDRLDRLPIVASAAGAPAKRPATPRYAGAVATRPAVPGTSAHGAAAHGYIPEGLVEAVGFFDEIYEGLVLPAEASGKLPEVETTLPLDEKTEDYTIARARVKDFIGSWMNIYLTGELDLLNADVSMLSPKQKLLATIIFLDQAQQEKLQKEIVDDSPELRAKLGAKAKLYKTDKEVAMAFMSVFMSGLFNFYAKKGSPEDKQLVLQAIEGFKFCYKALTALPDDGKTLVKNFLEQRGKYGDVTILLFSGSPAEKTAYYNHVQKLLKECEDMLSGIAGEMDIALAASEIEGLTLSEIIENFLKVQSRLSLGDYMQAQNAKAIQSLHDKLRAL